jgi:hypothetical protein
MKSSIFYVFAPLSMLVVYACATDPVAVSSSSSGTVPIVCSQSDKPCQGACVVIDDPKFGCSATSCEACPAATICRQGACTIPSVLPDPEYVKSATSFLSGGTWSAVALPKSLTDWANARYAGAKWPGSDGWNAYFTAYGDPAYDAEQNQLGFSLGGHDNGQANAFFKLDLMTLAWSELAAPTPLAAFPPDYLSNGPWKSQFRYPSGSFNGYAQTRATLTAPEDLPYAAPVAAPAQRHRYGGLVYHGGKYTNWYSTPWGISATTGKWELPAKISEFAASLNKCSEIWLNNERATPERIAARGADYSGGTGGNDLAGINMLLQENTSGVVDQKGKLWLTLTRGSNGSAWRNSIVRVDHASGKLEAIYDLSGMLVDGSTSLVLAGRDLYVFSAPSQLGDRGWKINTDTNRASYLTFSGIAPGMRDALQQEVQPGFYDGKSIYRWNHGVTTDRDALYKLTLEPASGAGTASDPYVLQQTRLQLPVSTMKNISFHYRMNVATYPSGAKGVVVATDAILYFLKF